MSSENSERQREASLVDMVLYKTGFIQKPKIKKAWKYFCESVEGNHEPLRLRRILAKNPISMGYLKNEDGE